MQSLIQVGVFYLIDYLAYFEDMERLILIQKIIEL